MEGAMLSLVGVVLIAVGVILLLRAASIVMRDDGNFVAMLTVSPGSVRPPSRPWSVRTRQWLRARGERGNPRQGPTIIEDQIRQLPAPMAAPEIADWMARWRGRR
ncbi:MULTISPECIES: hypothetical protein [unclassified Pseudonocardia]|uniref:hypothetical protein n=1 Tax=unclassified Pseudonocardia TaxID=2619320 RepID=UPI00094B0A09|nr:MULTISPECIES: hypothetical protein [unclassified Pseudonocardia]